MKITKPLSRRNRHEHRFHLHKLYDFCVWTGFLLLFICVTPLILNAEDTETEVSPATTNGAASAAENDAQEAASAENADGVSSDDSDGSTTEPTIETITGTSKRMERYEQEGITILIDEAKTIRYDQQGIEIGFLNADKITLKSDPETGTTTEVIAVGNVEIRDQDIFATCDHAIMNNLTNTVVLKENVVVLQDKDRLETKLFTFNRTTGKQTGEGGVKFKVTVTQAEPVEAEVGEDTEGDVNTDEDETSASAPEETEGDGQEDAEMSDADDNVDAEPDTDTGDSEDASPGEVPDTETENSGDTDTNAETEESESN